MVTTQDTLCACGCQQRVCTPGAMWRRGHYAKTHPQTKQPLVERFWARVQKTETCWLWTGGLRQGYGTIRRNGDPRAFDTHRISWEIHYGPIPDGLWVLHRCDKRACVRPDHLFLGNHADNMRDMMLKGRHGLQNHPERAARGDRNGARLHPNRRRYLYGEEHSQAKLTEDDVRAIRRLAIPGHITHKDLAQMFGVTPSLISCIVRRKIWKHLTD